MIQADIRTLEAVPCEPPFRFETHADGPRIHSEVELRPVRLTGVGNDINFRIGSPIGVPLRRAFGGVQARAVRTMGTMIAAMH